jgi:hypothetical protein
MTLERTTDCYPCQDQTVFGQNRVTDQVGGHLQLAISAEMRNHKGWKQEALHWIESAFKVEGFVSEHPYYENCLQRRARLRELLGMKDASPGIVRADSEEGTDHLDEIAYDDLVDVEAELAEVL